MAWLILFCNWGKCVAAACYLPWVWPSVIWRRWA